MAFHAHPPVNRLPHRCHPLLVSPRSLPRRRAAEALVRCRSRISATSISTSSFRIRRRRRRFYFADLQDPFCTNSRSATRFAISWCWAMCRPIGRSATSPSAPPGGSPAGHRSLLRAGQGLRLRRDGKALSSAAGFLAFAGCRRASGMWPDPDGLELQLFQPPAGLVTAAVRRTLSCPRRRPGDAAWRRSHAAARRQSGKALPYHRYGGTALPPSARATRRGASGSTSNRTRALG